MLQGSVDAHRLSTSKIPNWLVLLILLTYFHQDLPAQPKHYSSTLYTIEDGLPHNTVTFIGMDSYGFIWTSYTNNSISRFDGYRFTNYNTIGLNWEGRNSSFGNIYRDPQGDLIFSCPASIIKYNYHQDRFEKKPCGAEQGGQIFVRNGTIWVFNRNIIKKIVEHPDSGCRESTFQLAEEIGYVWVMEEFPGGELWIGATTGIYHLEESPGNIKTTRYNLIIQNQANASQICGHLTIIRNKLWIGTFDGIVTTDIPSPPDDEGEHVLRGELVNPCRPEIDLYKNTKPLGMIWDGANDIYFRTENGVYRYSIDNKYVERIYREKYNYYDVAEGIFQRVMMYDKRGLLWVGTDQGLLKINLGNENFFVKIPNPSDPGGLNNPRLNAVLVDRNNHLWVGTIGGGLYRSIPSKEGDYEYFEQYLPEPEDPFSLHDSTISLLFEDSRGRIYLSTGAKESRTQCIDVSTKRPKFLNTSVPRAAGPITSGQIREYSQDYIYIKPSMDRSGWINDQATGITYPFFLDKNRSGYTGGFLCRTSDNKCYLLANRTLYETTGGLIISDDPDPCLYPGQIRKLLDIGGDSGWGRFLVTENNGYKEFWIESVPPDNCLGRYRLPDPATGHGDDENLPPSELELIQKYNTGNGLSNNDIFEIIEDDRKRIWLSTQYGLTCIDPGSEQVYRFYENDGLPTNKFYWGYSKDHSGRIFLCTTNGLVYFHPDSVIQESSFPVYITGMRLFNKPLTIGKDAPLKQSIMYADRLMFQYDQNFLSLEFAALDLTNTEQVRYQYKMEGLDHDWVNAESRYLADYPNMKPGKYTFRVIASNSNGIWNREGASLDIFIKSPPWLRWWAYVLYGLVVIWIILWYRRFLLSRMKLRSDLEVERIEKEKVEELDRMRSRFFANISHEFRTPLTLLLGPMEDALKIRKPVIETDRGVFEMMRRNAKRLQRLINQLLDLSRLETGKIRLRISEGNLTEFGRTIVLSFLSLAESKKIKYEYELSEIPGPVYFDRDKLEKILTNLVSNAFKFTSPEGSIKITLKYIIDKEKGKPAFSEFSIIDSGHGIPLDQIEKIFDRFYQADSSESNEYEGTGIGLALTKELVDLYRGEINVESEIGKGSTFTVKLPVAKVLFKEDEIVTDSSGKQPAPIETTIAKAEPEKSELAEADTGVKEDAPMILIVEDNSDLRKYISQNLQSEFQILKAVNGREGMNRAFESIPDLVITDLMMPEMDGIEMCERIKNDGRTSHIPVIMLTAKADRDSKLEGLKTGADDYIIKPFDAEELRVRIQNLIEQRKRQRAAFMEEFHITSPDQNPEFQEDKLLNRILGILKENIANSEYNVENMGVELHMSRAQVFRKIGALTGSSPGDLLRVMRMKKAAALLLTGNLNIAQVMYEVGYQTPAYFARRFREYYGMNPSEYQRSNMA